MLKMNKYEKVWFWFIIFITAGFGLWIISTWFSLSFNLFDKLLYTLGISLLYLWVRNIIYKSLSNQEMQGIFNREQQKIK